MPLYPFGVGQLFITPSGANPTPVNCGTLQDVSLDVSRDVKEMYGANFAPEDVALGKMKITGKAKIGRLMGSLIQSVLAGATSTTGQTVGVPGETATIPSTPFSYTVVNGATFAADGGVFDVTTGKWMTCVATPSATGQYSLGTGGKYTFNSTDSTHIVQIFYSYTVTTGVTSTLNNALMGTCPVFTMNVYNTTKGQNLGWTLYAVIFPKISFDHKQDDYTTYDVEFQAFANSAGQVLSMYQPS